VIAEGAPRELIAAHCPERHLEFATAARSDLSFLSGVERLEPRNDGLVPVRVRKGCVESDLVEVLARQRRGEIVAEDLHLTAQTLEDVFIKLTGRGIRA
jgi:hypothetical protein